MSNRDDRSVKTGDIIGSQVVTGDQNRVTMKGTKVELPRPEDVEPARVLEQLRTLLASMQGTPAGKVRPRVAGRRRGGGKAGSR